MPIGQVQATAWGRALLQAPSESTAMPLHSATQALSNVTPPTAHTGCLVVGQSHKML
jgi:hypothetical protein